METRDSLFRSNLWSIGKVISFHLRVTEFIVNEEYIFFANNYVRRQNTEATGWE